MVEKRTYIQLHSASDGLRETLRLHYYKISNGKLRRMAQSLTRQSELLYVGKQQRNRIYFREGNSKISVI